MHEVCEDLNLKRYGSQAVGNLQFVNLGGELDTPLLPAFDTHAKQGRFSELQAYTSKSYDVRANWKHIIENFLDYLHVPAIHPSLAPSSRVDDHHPSPCIGQHIAFHTNPIRPSKKNPLCELHVPSTLLCEETLFFHVLFPNCFLFTHPTHMFVVFIDPVSPDRSTERSYLLLNKQTMEKTPYPVLQGLANFYDDVNEEDIRIVEQCQEGSYGEERHNRVLLPVDKYLYAFQEMYRDAMAHSHDL